MKQFTFLKSVLLMALLFVAGSVGAKDVATLKALLQDASTTETYTLTNPVTVVYQNGKYLYVKDASASALVYGTINLTGLVNGQTVSGLQCTYKLYNAMPELIPATDITLTASDAASAVAVNPAAVTIKGITTALANQYVKLSRVSLKSDFTFASKAKSVLAYQGDNSITVYNQFGTVTDKAFTADTKYDVVGFVTVYNGTLEIQPLTMTAVVDFGSPSFELIPEVFKAGTAYKMYNVGIHKYLTNGNAWGTHAIFGSTGNDMTFTSISDGVYSISNVIVASNSTTSSNSSTSLAGKSRYLYRSSADTTDFFVDLNTIGAKGYFTISKVDEDQNYYKIGVASNNLYPIAGYAGWNGDATVSDARWITPTSNAVNNYSWALYSVDQVNHVAAKTALYNKINEAKGYYVDVTDAVNILYAASSTTADLNNQIAALNSAILAAKVAGATKENPVDVTSAIVNPGFDNGTTGWTNPGSAANSEMEQFANPTNNFTTYQILTGLPNGVYVLKCQGFCRDNYGSWNASDAVAYRKAGTEVLDAYLFANTQKTALMSILDDPFTTNEQGGEETDYGYVPNSMENAQTAFAAGRYDKNSVQVVVTDGTLKLGIDKQTSTSHDWVIFDNFRLLYTGAINVSDLITLVQSQVDEATPLLTEVGQKSVITALAADVTKATAAIQAQDASTLLEVNASLTTDIPAAKTSIASYKTLTDALATANALNNSTNYPGKADFATAIAAANTVLTEATADAATIDAAVATLNTAVDAYKFSLTKGASATNPVDVTFLITNPNMDLTTGWVNPGAYGLSEMEVFNANTIDVYQILRNMPAGTYKLSCQAFYRAGGFAAAAASRDAGTEAFNVSLYANSTSMPVKSILDEAQDARIYTSSDWQSDAEITLGGATKYIPNSMAGSRKWFDADKYNNDLFFNVAGVDTVRLGIKKSVHIDSDWTLFDNFKLTYYGESYTPLYAVTAISDPATELTDGQTYVAYNKGRKGFLYENESNKQLMLKSGTTLALPQSATFAVKAIKSGDKYKFQIVGTGDYVKALAHGGNTFAGDAAAAESFTPAYNTSASCWYIKGSGSDYWNGNPTTFTGWNATGGNSAYALSPCTLTASEVYVGMLKDALAAVATTGYLTHKGQVGYPVDAAFDAYQAAYDNALAIYANGTCNDVAGCVGYTILTKALDAFKAAERNMPLAGTFYQIQNFWNNRGALCNDANIYPYVQSTAHSGATVAATNDFNFGVFVFGGKTYLYNAATKQFLAPVAAPTTEGKHYTSQDPDGKAGLVWEFTDTPTAVTFSTEGMSIPNIWIKTADDSRTLSISPSYSEPVITYYEAGDGGVPMTFTDMGAASEDVVTAISRYFVPAGKYYQIASAYNRGNLYFDSANTLNFVESTGKTGETVSDEDNFSFGIIDYMGATYVFNKANGEFLAPVAGTLDAGASADEQFGEYWQFVSAPTQVAVNYYKNDTYKISSVVKGLTKVLSIENRYFEPVTTYYAQNDEGFPMILTEKGDIEASRLAGIQQMIYNGMVTGINTASKTVAGYEYYSTNGTKLQKAAKGVNIVRVHFTDGTSKISKIVVR